MKPLNPELIQTLPATPAAYVLLGKNNIRYTGAARNFQERMRDHHAGRASRTKHQRPLSLIYYEALASYADALVRERFLKSGQGRAFLAAQTSDCPAEGGLASGEKSDL